MAKTIGSVAVFIFLSALGLFCSWIGGVEPFTRDAGFAAVMTSIVALWSAILFQHVDWRN